MSKSTLMLNDKVKPIPMKTITTFTILVSFLFAADHLVSAKSIESYIHKNAILAVPPLSFPPPADMMNNSVHQPISPREACSYAIEKLEAKEIKNIVICEVQWIAAPVSGYLIDIKGKLLITGESFSIFRIGILDGREKDKQKYPAGKEFVFIAFGKNNKDKAIWYPEPGPGYMPIKNEATPESFFIYEFLLNRERFETLYERYP